MSRWTAEMPGFRTNSWLRFAFLQVVILPLIWGSSALAQGDCNPNAPGNVRVGVSSFVFTPADVTIDCGETVCFVWDSSGHTSTADNGAWDTGGHVQGFTFGVQFNAPAASVPYHCTFHALSGGQGMRGVIHVLDNCGNPSTPTRTRTPRPTRTRTPTVTLTPIPGPTSAPFERSGSPLALLAVLTAICAMGLARLRKSRSAG